MNIHDALEYLKNLDISLDDDIFDNEDFISNWRMVILPWNNEGDRDTNEDSGDENELLSNNLNRSQLLSGATVDLSTSSGNILPGSGDEEEERMKCIFVSLISCWHDKTLFTLFDMTFSFIIVII